MARKICITEEQYNMALKEGILEDSNQKFSVNAQQQNGQSEEQNVVTTMEKLKQKYQNAEKDFEVVSPDKKNNKTQIVSKSDTNDNNISVMEKKLVTKRELQENRLKSLKKNSNVYTVKDFIKKYNN